MTGAQRFEELEVVEVAGSVAGAWAAKLFADHGAHVVKVEPPGGDPLRRCGEPWRNGAGTLSAHLDTSKSSVVVDLDTAGGRASLATVLGDADVVIESSAPDPLQPVSPGLGHDGLVTVLLSPFGLSGPHASWRATSLIDEAASGHLHLSGDPDREPLRGPGLQSAYAAGAIGFFGAMAALWARRRDGRGQTVEVSHVEAMVALHQFTFVKHTHGGQVLRRLGNRYAGPGYPIGGYACADGWVSLSAPAGDQVERLLAVTDLLHLLEGPGAASMMDLQSDPDVIDEALRPWMAERTVAEVVELFQAMRIPADATLTMHGLLDDPHMAERGFWHEMDGLRHVGPPFRFGRHHWRPTPAPAVGDGPSAAARTGSPAALAPPGSDDAAPTGPLAGLRVLDLTRVWSGPLATRMLADLGADVVLVEAPWARGGRRLSPSRARSTGFYPAGDPGPRPWNRNGFFNEYALGKRSVSLDIRDPAGRAALERLVVASDVLIENYSARVMPQLGLDEDRLHELNPSLVYVTMPGYGRSGPARDWVAYGNVLDGHAGMTSITGYPGEHPWKSGVAWPDAVAGIHAAGATLVALWDRAGDPDHRGDTVEVAQLETLVATLGHEVLAAQVRGTDRAPYGNRHPVLAPQGVYPCSGHDRWIAVSVTDEPAWAALSRLLELDEELAGLDLTERRAAHDRLDEVISRWTRGQEAVDVATRLQEEGVAASAVLDAPGVMADPHLRARSVFVTVDHVDAGPMPFARLPVQLSATPAPSRRPAPLLGEHNEEVLVGVAGLDLAELADLVASGVVAEVPPA